MDGMDLCIFPPKIHSLYIFPTGKNVRTNFGTNFVGIFGAIADACVTIRDSNGTTSSTRPLLVLGKIRVHGSIHTDTAVGMDPYCVDGSLYFPAENPLFVYFSDG